MEPRNKGVLRNLETALLFYVLRLYEITCRVEERGERGLGSEREARMFCVLDLLGSASHIDCDRESFTGSSTEL